MRGAARLILSAGKGRRSSQVAPADPRSGRNSNFQAVGPNGEDIQIGPPYGQEIAVAFAASEPLFDEIRPLIEPAEPYLAWLREKVAAARAADPDFKGEWVYFFVATRGE